MCYYLETGPRCPLRKSWVGQDCATMTENQTEAHRFDTPSDALRIFNDFSILLDLRVVEAKQ